MTKQSNFPSNIVKGQEAICPDGPGRVIDFCDDFPGAFIQVSTYVNDRGCKWAPHNVDLIPPPTVEGRPTPAKSKETEVGEAIEHAAQRLPEGYRIRMDIEHEGYAVYLLCPNTHIGICMEEENLDLDIREAVKIAHERAKADDG